MAAKPRLKSTTNKRYPWVVGGLYVGNKRIRKYFKSKTAAQVYLAQVTSRLTEEGRAGWSLSDANRVSAAKALEILGPYGADLVEAARHYAAHLDATRRSLSFDDLSKKFQSGKRADGRSGRHLSDLKFRLGRFGEAFGSRLATEVTTSEVDDWLREHGGSPQSRENFRKVVRAVFQFAVNHDYAAKNPVARVSRVKVPSKIPEILRPSQMRSLLAAAQQMARAEEVVPFIAIAGFAGIRAAEIERLDWSAVDLERSRIRLDRTKTSVPRWVDISPNLGLWLAPYKKSGGSVASKMSARLRTQAAEAAGLKWGNNLLRHTFGSAYAVKSGNKAMTVEQMGNSREQLLRSYLNLITPEDAAEWFSIVPQDGTNIVQLGTKAG